MAWHSHAEGEYEALKVVCHACTAKRGEEAFYSFPQLWMKPERLKRLPAFDLNDPKSTTPPREKPSSQEA